MTRGGDKGCKSVHISWIDRLDCYKTKKSPSFTPSHSENIANLQYHGNNCQFAVFHNRRRNEASKSHGEAKLHSNFGMSQCLEMLLKRWKVQYLQYRIGPCRLSFEEAIKSALFRREGNFIAASRSVWRGVARDDKIRRQG